MLTIETTHNVLDVRIYNFEGLLVQEENTKSFSVEKLPKGIYLIYYLTPFGPDTFRFVKE